VLLIQFSEVLAKDFGVHGTLFEIKEEDMLETINARLKTLERSGVLALRQKEMKSAALKSVLYPRPIRNISDTAYNKAWDLDPTYIVQEDIINHDGTILHKAGTKINPLETIALQTNLMFINGKNAEQIQWALDRCMEVSNRCKLILINGSPGELSKKYKRDFYFDQNGSISKKLGITQVPALVTQNGLKLRIEELVLRK
jgi:conjugal transfer pilus assembly protein TraW